MTDIDHPSEGRLHAFLDRELEPAEHRAIEAHLEACSDCQQRMAALVTLFESLREMPERSLGRDLSAPVVTSLRARRRESALVARLAWAQALVALAVGALVWLLTGGLATSAYPSVGLAGELARLRMQLDGVVRLLLAPPAELLSSMESLLVEAARLGTPVSLSPPDGSSWAPFLALALALWLIGNGVLLRGGGERGSR